MYAVGARSAHEQTNGTGHAWVGAALVGLGTGGNGRAEHAARTGRHVVFDKTRIEVLEVYCGRCRLAYSPTAGRSPCRAVRTRKMQEVGHAEAS